MKLLAACLICIACLSVSAENQPDNRVHFACTAVTPLRFLKCQTTLGSEAGRKLIGADARYRSVEDFARHAQVGDLWWPEKSNDRIVVTFAASEIRQEDRIFRLQGNAEIHTTSQILLADDAFYHSDTGEIEAHGEVRVKPVVSLP